MKLLELAKLHGTKNLIININTVSMVRGKRIEQLEYFIIDTSYEINDKVRFKCITNVNVPDKVYAVVDFDIACLQSAAFGIHVITSANSDGFSNYLKLTDWIIDDSHRFMIKELYKVCIRGNIVKLFNKRYRPSKMFISVLLLKDGCSDYYIGDTRHVYKNNLADQKLIAMWQTYNLLELFLLKVPTLNFQRLA